MGFNRRQLFKLRLGDLSREVGKAFAPSPGGDADTEALPDTRPRPPGALADEAAFLDRCERCGACAEACPYGAIFKHGPATGRREGTPFLDPAQSPCRWCQDMPCITACPSGALRRDPEKAVPPVARVRLDPDRCLNSQGILCDTCSYRCPSHIGAIRMVARMPQLDADRCTGCGMCIFHCDAEPSAFQYEP